MAIEGKELEKEKLILKKVTKLLNQDIDELKQDVKLGEDDLLEFKKLTWSDVSMYNDGDVIQAKELTAKKELEEAKKTAYETMMKCYDRNIYDWGTIKNRVRDDVSKLMYERTKRSPMILPILMEI